jgi:hypothetical protein
MPYIKQDRRKELDTLMATGEINIADVSAGDLNYLMSCALDEYIEAHGKSYDTINKVIGVLECVKLELYRRVAAPYEDTKIEENGDVYTV